MKLKNFSFFDPICNSFQKSCWEDKMASSAGYFYLIHWTLSKKYPKTLEKICLKRSWKKSPWVSVTALCNKNFIEVSRVRLDPFEKKKIDQFVSIALIFLFTIECFNDHEGTTTTILCLDKRLRNARRDERK